MAYNFQLQKAPMQRFDPDFALGLRYYNLGIGGDASAQVTAISHIRLSSERGFAPAQRLLASCLLHGVGVDVDSAQALYWYKRAADQGEPASACMLAKFLIYGMHVERDPASALQYLHNAATLAYPPAIFFIGECYERGNVNGTCCSR